MRIKKDEATKEIWTVDNNTLNITLTAWLVKNGKSKFFSRGLIDDISKYLKKAFLFEILDKYIS